MSNYTVNIDPETKIPYGIINQNSCPRLAQEIIMNGENISETQRQLELCLEVGAFLDDPNPLEFLKERDCESLLEELEDAIEGFNPDTDTEESRQVVAELIRELLTRNVESTDFDGDNHLLQKDGLTVMLSEFYIWVFKSPVVAIARACSPCVPNATDLDNPDEYGQPGYAIPLDWFDEGEAPYETQPAETLRCKQGK